MIDAKQAVALAKMQAIEMLNQTAFSLEEIERDVYRGREVWVITLSFARDLDQLTPVARLSVDPLQYKRFLIDVESGEVLAMTIREVASR